MQERDERLDVLFKPLLGNIGLSVIVIVKTVIWELAVCPSVWSISVSLFTRSIMKLSNTES